MTDPAAERFWMLTRTLEIMNQQTREQQSGTDDCQKAIDALIAEFEATADVSLARLVLRTIGATGLAEVLTFVTDMEAQQLLTRSPLASPPEAET